MHTLELRDETIKLGQALKASGLVRSGAEAKAQIQNGQVRLNGEVVLMRGKKCQDGDVIAMGEETVVLRKRQDS